MDVREAYAHYLSTHFGRAGRQDDANFLFQERYFRKNYLPFLPKDKNSRIIDLGTGLGHVLFFLKRAGYNDILGVDVGHEVIEFCKQHKFPVVEEEIVTWLKQNKESADALVLNDVLEHQTKPEMWEMLEAMRDALKPGGVVLIKVPNMGNPLLGNDSRYLDITHQNGFNENSLRQALFMAKYSKVHVIGPDIYVTNNVVVNVLCRAIASVLDVIFYGIFRFYGRTETKIFRKNILAIAQK